jgi:hypothetical protein
VINKNHLDEYLAWKRERELYPAKLDPEEYVEYLLDKDARGKLIMIQNIFDNQDPDFLASNSNELTDMIDKIVNG